VKTIIFVIGAYESGKTSIVKALTGSHGRKTKSNNPRLWYVRTLNGNRILALVLWSALQEDSELKNVPPSKIIEKLEEMYGNEYELIVCPLELNVGGNLYDFTLYLDVFIANGYDVRVSAIENSWNGRIANISRVRNYLLNKNLPTVILDIGNSDAHMESRKVRDNLYPP